MRIIKLSTKTFGKNAKREVMIHLPDAVYFGVTSLYGIKNIVIRASNGVMLGHVVEGSMTGDYPCATLHIAVVSKSPTIVPRALVLACRAYVSARADHEKMSMIARTIQCEVLIKGAYKFDSSWHGSLSADGAVIDARARVTNPDDSYMMTDDDIATYQGGCMARFWRDGYPVHEQHSPHLQAQSIFASATIAVVDEAQAMTGVTRAQWITSAHLQKTYVNSVVELVSKLTAGANSIAGIKSLH